MSIQAPSNSDRLTAEAFASSWNNLPEGSVYTTEQVLDWFVPLAPADFAQKRVLELGCGNGSILVHVAAWQPAYLEGIDLGSSVRSARINSASLDFVKIKQADIVDYNADEKFDVVYCIGVIHHMQNPQKGFDAVVRNVRAGGRFHCWVYGWEGNAVVRIVVDPLRRICCKLPWWITKYLFATPLAVPLFVCAKLVRFLGDNSTVKRIPLAPYLQWLGKGDLTFARHVVFDQLVTPHTVYIRSSEIWQWLRANPEIDQKSVYVINRNGNSWKFGGVKSF